MAQYPNRDDKLKALVNSSRNASGRTADSAAENNPPRENVRPAAGSASRAPRPSGPAHGRAQNQRKPERGLIFLIKHNAVGILSVVAVSVIVVLMLVFLRGCGMLGSGENGANDAASSTEAASNGESSPYDWTNLDRTDGRFAYVVNGETLSRFGIDVSDNQHEVDWDAVAGDGVQFAMIRLGYRGATEGDLYVDEQYYANIAGAQAAGIDRGIYFFSQAISEEEAREEADFVLSNLGGVPLEYPVAFDSEVIPSLGETRTANLSNEEMTAIADAFCERIEAGGYDTIVYGNFGDLTRYDIENLDGRGIWWAEYGQPTPLTNASIEMWQYANDGVIDGIDTAVDLNIDLPPALSS